MRGEAKSLICLDPGFPVNRLQLRLLGLTPASIDFFDHRGDALLRAVEDRVKQGDVCGIIWSSPNNPSWIVLKESELKGLGRICDEYGVLAIEDLAYFGMDTREDYYTPGEPPYQPTVLRYTKRGISLVSSSKIFSYAGQRIALAFLAPELMQAEEPGLVERCGTANVGHAFLHGGLYPFDHGADLIRELLRYGVSAITLETTGSSRVEGLRACVSLTDDSRFGELEERLKAFHADHPIR